MFKSKEIRKLAEQNGGELPAYAWPGGYPVVYVCTDGEEICPACANSGDESLEIVGFEVFYEGPMFYCACGTGIESAYGDPDAEEQN